MTGAGGRPTWEDEPMVDVPKAILKIDPDALAAFAGVTRPLPTPGDCGLAALLERLVNYRPDLIRAIDRASAGLADIDVFGADTGENYYGGDDFIGIEIKHPDADGDPVHVTVDERLLSAAASIRAALAAVLPLITEAPLCIVIDFN